MMKSIEIGEELRDILNNSDCVSCLIQLLHFFLYQTLIEQNDKDFELNLNTANK